MKTTLSIVFAILLFAIIPLSAEAAPSWSDSPKVPWTSEADQFTDTFTEVQDFSNTVKPVPEIGAFRGKGKAARKAYNKLKKQNKVTRERTFERKTRDLEKIYERSVADISVNDDRRQVGITSSADTISRWLDAAQEEEQRTNDYNYNTQLAALEGAQDKETSQVAANKLVAVNNANNTYNSTVAGIKNTYSVDVKSCGTDPATKSPVTKPKKPSKKDKKYKQKIKVYNAQLKAYNKYLKKKKAYDSCISKLTTKYQELVGGLDSGQNSAGGKRDTALGQADIAENAANVAIQRKYDQARLNLQYKYGKNIAVAYDEMRAELETRAELYSFRSSRQLEEERRISEDAYDKSKDAIQDAYDIVEDEDED